QGVNFRNDGYFGVGAIDGYATGVLNGYDVTATRQVINTGTIEVLSNYGAVGVALGPFSGFDNSGLIYVEAPVNAIGVDWRQYGGGSFTNGGTIYVLNDPSSELAAIGIVLTEHTNSVAPRIIENSGLISADVAIWVRDTSPAAPLAEIVMNTGDIEGAILLGAGNDEVHNNAGGRIFGTILLEAGNDLYDGVGGDLFGEVRGGMGNDTYRIDNADTRIIEDVGGGNDHVQSFVSYTLGANFEMLTLLGGDALSGTGNSLWNRITGNDGANILTGGLGNDTINGGGNIDTAVVSGNRADYTVTQTSSGVFEVSGPDGTDTLTAVEYLQFDDETIRLLPGTGISVTFDANDSSGYQSAMGNIRDFDGNALGGDGSWVWIGAADVNGDGDVDQVLVNPEIGRFATIGTAEDGLIYFDDHGWAGETRVAGIYIDPLVASGDVVAGSDHDSQRRFQNDLEINNIVRVLGAGDYDGDGLQEVYFALNDGTAYLHAYMHADGNIRYANYQSEQQVIDFLTANGFDSSIWAGWFPAGQEDSAKGFDVMEPEAFALFEAAILNPAGEPDPMASFRFVEPQHEVFA
ncbi:MAG: hypothetical protein KDD98_00005, partial [Sphingomonadaceae bacterium]|nr:hypothetical protein [Sphingomonadaceae bacterium]